MSVASIMEQILWNESELRKRHNHLAEMKLVATVKNNYPVASQLRKDILKAFEMDFERRQCIKSSFLGSLQFLVQAGYEIEVDTCLILERELYGLTSNKYIQIVSRLVRMSHGFWSRTRLMYACRTGNLARAKLLIEKYFADIYFEGKLQATAIGYALTAGNDEMSDYVRNGKVISQNCQQPFHERMKYFVPVENVPVMELHGHTESIVAICSLRDGRVVSSSLDNTIRIWFCNGSCQFIMVNQEPDDVLIELSRHRLASSKSTRASRISIWCTTAGNHLYAIALGTNIKCTCLLEQKEMNCQNLLLIGTGDMSLQVWDTIHRKKLEVYYDGNLALDKYKKSNDVSCVCSISGTCFASGSNDGYITLYYNVDSLIVRSHRFKDEALFAEKDCGRVLCMALLPDGRLAAANGDGRVRFWIWNDMKDTCDYLTDDETKFHGCPTSLFVAPGGILVSGGDVAETARLWNYNTRTCTGISGPVDAKAVLSDGRVILKWLKGFPTVLNRTSNAQNDIPIVWADLNIYNPNPGARYSLYGCDAVDLNLLCNLVHGQYVTSSKRDCVLRLYRKINM